MKLKQLWKVGCCVLALGLVSSPFWSLNHADGFTIHSLIIADNGNGNGGGGDNGGNGPGDGNGNGGEGPGDGSGNGAPDGAGDCPGDAD